MPQGSRIRSNLALSAAGDMSRRSQTTFSGDGGAGNTTGNTISFTAPATIADSGNGLGWVRAGDLIGVRGSATNSRRWRVTTAAAGSLTVTPAVVTNELAGAVITLTRE